MNNKNQLENQLRGMGDSFGPGFEDRVMTQLHTEKIRRRRLNLWSTRFVSLAAACVVFVLMITYLQYGTITGEGILGLEGFSSVELSESETYTTVYNE